MSNYAVAYLRVSTAEQAETGASLDAQRTAITAAAKARGLEIVAWHEDAGVSGKTAPEKRDGLSAALAALAAGPASVLLVAKLDRLVRSVHYLSGMVEQAQTQGWTMAAADGGIDLTTPQGVAMAQVSGVFAELERKLIGIRTSEGMAERRAQGVHVGRPTELSDDVVRRIVTGRRAGAGWSEIARTLNAEGVTTARGKTWLPNGVRQVFYGTAAARVRAQDARTLEAAV
ncbi:MAG TPA: recombinase family protein [Candidatus Eisenbacteria bacterium]|nr:recombinase family protein [Candidatus Eisenbacteria bacterium]